MEYTLKNNELEVTFSDHGAEMISVKRGNCEYLWQADPTYWNGHAPIMFPICGRLTDGKYTYRGKTYEMRLHGFTRGMQFRCTEQTEDAITFVLESDAVTLSQYPFDFTLTAVYRLAGNEVIESLTVLNRSGEMMPFAAGGHPGFNVPLDGTGTFSDYRIEFGEVCSPDYLLFSDTCYQTGKKRALPLENGTTLPLRHTLFDNDAIFLARPASVVSLKSDKTERYVTLKTNGIPYLGIWHKPKTEAPYVCIEPWTGLPAYDQVVDDFETKSDMFRILPGTEKTVSFSVIFG